MVSESVLRDENGDVTAYAHRLTLDAERRALLHELSASQGLLDEAQAIARVGSWELDFATDTMTWSRPDVRDPRRRPATAGRPSADAFLEQIVAEDRELVTERFLAGQQEGRSPSTPGSSGSTARCVWVRGIGRVTYARGRHATRIGGTTQDISDIKEAELQLLDAVVLNSLMQVMASAATRPRPWRGADDHARHVARGRRLAAGVAFRSSPTDGTGGSSLAR